MSSCSVSENSCQLGDINRQAVARPACAPSTSRKNEHFLLLASLVATLKMWRSRARERRRLRYLSDRSLHDMGITYDQAREEWSKPFWR